LQKLNFDSLYVSTIATDHVYFVVTAEDGMTTITYQLTPNANPSDAYVTSDVYSVDQFGSLIKFVPQGTTVASLLANLTPAPGATMAVYDKSGFQRTMGNIYRDDKVVVTSSNGEVTKAYYFSMLAYSNAGIYLAYVISDDYQVDQVYYEITGATTTSVSAFFAKLYPAFGATLSIIDKNGNVNNSGTLNQGDVLLVTAADGVTTAKYNISAVTRADAAMSSSIKVYPNPTTDGKVILQGLSKGNRVQVYNVAGVLLRDVIVNNTTEYVNLSYQPSGIYMFVISSGEKRLDIKKVIKK
jgi:hypothetical protein